MMIKLEWVGVDSHVSEFSDRLFDLVFSGHQNLDQRQTLLGVTQSLIGIFLNGIPLWFMTEQWPEIMKDVFRRKKADSIRVEWGFLEVLDSLLGQTCG